MHARNLNPNGYEHHDEWPWQLQLPCASKHDAQLCEIKRMPDDPIGTLDYQTASLRKNAEGTP